MIVDKRDKNEIYTAYYQNLSTLRPFAETVQDLVLFMPQNGEQYSNLHGVLSQLTQIKSLHISFPKDPQP